MKLVYDYATKCTYIYNKDETVKRRGVGITKLVSKWLFHPKWSLQSVSGSHGGGADLGNRVDHEIRRWAKSVAKGQAESTIHRKIAKYCQESKQLIAACMQRDWVPVYAQRLVGCFSSRLATRCDLVLRHAKSRKLILLEIKTGYTDTFDDEEGKVGEQHYMRPPFHSIRANPKRFALVQLLLTWILYRTTFPDEKIEHANVRVAHVTSQGVSFHSLPASWALQVRKVLVARMKERNEMKFTKYKRKKSIGHKKTKKRLKQ